MVNRTNSTFAVQGKDLVDPQDLECDKFDNNSNPQCAKVRSNNGDSGLTDQLEYRNRTEPQVKGLDKHHLKYDHGVKSLYFTAAAFAYGETGGIYPRHFKHEIKREPWRREKEVFCDEDAEGLHGNHLLEHKSSEIENDHSRLQPLLERIRLDATCVAHEIILHVDKGAAGSNQQRRQYRHEQKNRSQLTLIPHLP